MSEQRTVVKRVENAKLYSDGTIVLENVRASYPYLFEPRENEGDDGKKTYKYQIQVILPKATHGAAKDICVARINDLCRENKVEKLPADKKFIKNGDDMAKAEYENAFIVSASESNRPDLRGKDPRVKLTDADKDVIYGGCYVDVLIRPWFQNNKYGKRCNAGLVAVRFREDGEAFGNGRISAKDVDDAFDAPEDSGSFGGDDEEL